MGGEWGGINLPVPNIVSFLSFTLPSLSIHRNWNGCGWGCIDCVVLTLVWNMFSSDLLIYLGTHATPLELTQLYTQPRLPTHTDQDG